MLLVYKSPFKPPMASNSMGPPSSRHGQMPHGFLSSSQVPSSPPLNPLSSQAHAGQTQPASQLTPSQTVPDTQTREGDDDLLDEDNTEPLLANEDHTGDSILPPNEDESSRELEMGRGGDQDSNDDNSSQPDTIDGKDEHAQDDAQDDAPGDSPNYFQPDQIQTNGTSPEPSTPQRQNLSPSPHDGPADPATPSPAASFEPDYAWEDLLQRFRVEMAQKRAEEQAIMQRCERLQVLYQIWASKGAEKEETRATKRLCTRIEHVKHSEQKLQTRQEHRDKVVNAFESAMRLFD